MTQVGIDVSEQQIHFIFNDFDPQKLKNEKEVERFIQKFVIEQEKDMLSVNYEPDMNSDVGG